MPTLDSRTETTTPSSNYYFYKVNNVGDTENKIEIQNIFGQNLSSTSSPTFENVTVTNSLSVPTSILNSGGYTSSLSNVYGLGTVDSQNISYAKYDDVVVVSGIIVCEKVNDGPGGNTNSLIFDMTLPFSTTLSADSDLIGICYMKIDSDQRYAVIYGNTSNDQARVHTPRFSGPTEYGTTSCYLKFMYKVV